MLPISVTIIARDEADRIGEAIRSVAFADEVLVLDSGSRDDTPAVARALGARVVLTDWPGHVAQKNRAVAEARHDWILSLDADERVGPALARAIDRVRREGPRAAGYRVRRLNHWLGRPIRHGTWYPDRRVRLFDRRRARFVGLDPHDRVAVDGPVADLDAELLHHPYRDLDEHLRTTAAYAETWARAAAAAGRIPRWWDLAFRPPLHFVKAILLRRGFLDGPAGWTIAWLGAAGVLLKWAHLWARVRAAPATGEAP